MDINGNPGRTSYLMCLMQPRRTDKSGDVKYRVELGPHWDKPPRMPPVLDRDTIVHVNQDNPV